MTLDRLSLPISTERLRIRRLRADDLGASYALRSQPDVGRWLTRTETDRAAYAERFATAEVQDHTLVIERDGQLIGDLYLKVRDGWAQADVQQDAVGSEAEIGWVLDPAQAGQGLATEAVRELLRLCFADLGVRRVVALCFALNEPSWRLMERIGMRREGYNVAESLHAELGWIDGMTYALLAEEWLDQS